MTDHHLRSTRPPFVYLHVIRDPADVDGLGAGLEGLVVRRIDGARCTTKADLLTAFARALEFPDYAGDGWDAFEECLNDLEWLPGGGYVVVIGAAERLLPGAEQDYATFIDILESAGREWAAGRTGEFSRPPVPFHVVLAVSRAGASARRDWRVPTRPTGRDTPA